MEEKERKKIEEIIRESHSIGRSELLKKSHLSAKRLDGHVSTLLASDIIVKENEMIAGDNDHNYEKISYKWK